MTELEATLVLRAARFQLGDRAAASSLTQRCRELATQAGFPPPAEEFGGRQDLRRLWLRVPFGHAQPTAPGTVKKSAPWIPSRQPSGELPPTDPRQPPWAVVQVP